MIEFQAAFSVLAEEVSEYIWTVFSHFLPGFEHLLAQLVEPFAFSVLRNIGPDFTCYTRSIGAGSLWIGKPT